MVGAVVRIEEVFFFDGVEVRVLPWPPRGFPIGAAGGGGRGGGGLAPGAGEACGGRFAGMGAQGGVRVGMRRRAQWALEWA